MAQIISPARATALHLDTVKRHLLIDHTADDLLLTSMIATAQRWIDDYCQTAMVQKSYRMTLDGFYQHQHRYRMQGKQYDVLTLWPVPLLVVDSIKYLDPDGLEHLLPSQDYRVNFNAGSISLAYPNCWPATLPIKDAVSIEYKAGHLIPLQVNSTDSTLAAYDILFSAGSQIWLESNHTLPTGLGTGLAPYYVVNPVATQFQISTTPNGAPVTFTDIGTGTLFAGYISKCILHAMLLLIGTWYAHRENDIAERGVQFDTLPMGVKSLLAPYRMLTV